MRRLVVLAALAAFFVLPGGARTRRRTSATACRTTRGSSTVRERSTAGSTSSTALGVDVVRVTIDWRATEPRPGVYDWARADLLLDGLHSRGIAPLVTLYGSPGWANGGLPENYAPVSKTSFAAFARNIAKRYPYVHMWTVWNEPNQRRWLRPTTPATYVKKLLNPAYAAIHSVSPSSQVAGGVTAPRGSTGGVSPVAWIAGMAAAHARLDAYAHNPYPLRPGETPMSGGCDHCDTITMATLPRLLRDVQKAFGVHTRIWLTEYGYQTNPPDKLLGVSYATQAKYVSEAALCAYDAPRVDVLIHYLVEDEPDPARWQSGVYTAADHAKPALAGAAVPVHAAVADGTAHDAVGSDPSRRRRDVSAAAVRRGHVGPRRADMRTTARGYLKRAVNAAPGAARVRAPRLGSPAARATRVRAAIGHGARADFGRHSSTRGMACQSELTGERARVHAPRAARLDATRGTRPGGRLFSLELRGEQRLDARRVRIARRA